MGRPKKKAIVLLPPTVNRWLRLKEVQAKLGGISHTKLYDLIEGTPGFPQPNRRTGIPLFSDAEVERWMLNGGPADSEEDPQGRKARLHAV